MLKDGVIEALGPNVKWLNGYFDLNRVDVFHTTSDVIKSYEINRRIAVFVYESWSV